MIDYKKLMHEHNKYNAGTKLQCIVEDNKDFKLNEVVYISCKCIYAFQTTYKIKKKEYMDFELNKIFKVIKN